MKANEFIKEHGLQHVKSIILQFPNHTHVTNDARMFVNENTCANHIKYQLNELVRMSDLKRLVESHEFINERGGLEHVKNLIATKIHWFDVDAIIKTNQSIADVESCQ